MLLKAGFAALVLALAALATAPAAPAQEAAREPRPFLFINQERLLIGSQAGQALLAEEEEARDALRAEARAIDGAFEEEERRLTEQRAELTPEAFRELADDFDSRVVAARREQDERAAALALQFEQARRQFYASIAPILVDLMEEYAAMAIFDESSVLLADQSINITEQVILEIDAGSAEAGATPEAPEPDATDNE